jgi:probable rRNA maturation factor
MNVINNNQIAFHSEGISFALKNESKIAQWLVAVAKEEGKRIAELNYIFCSDEYLLQMNLEYLQHDTLTDVITFQYADEVVHGDVFISEERTRENAAKFGVTSQNELCRVVVHGLLHLIGYGDKTEEEAALMREKENQYLGLLAELS